MSGADRARLCRSRRRRGAAIVRIEVEADHVEVLRSQALIGAGSSSEELAAAVQLLLDKLVGLHRTRQASGGRTRDFR